MDDILPIVGLEDDGLLLLDEDSGFKDEDYVPLLVPSRPFTPTQSITPDQHQRMKAFLATYCDEQASACDNFLHMMDMYEEMTREIHDMVDERYITQGVDKDSASSIFWMYKFLIEGMNNWIRVCNAVKHSGVSVDQSVLAQPYTQSFTAIAEVVEAAFPSSNDYKTPKRPTSKTTR